MGQRHVRIAITRIYEHAQGYAVARDNEWRAAEFLKELARNHPGITIDETTIPYTARIANADVVIVLALHERQVDLAEDPWGVALERIRRHLKPKALIVLCGFGMARAKAEESLVLDRAFGFGRVKVVSSVQELDEDLRQLSAD